MLLTLAASTAAAQTLARAEFTVSARVVHTATIRSNLVAASDSNGRARVETAVASGDRRAEPTVRVHEAEARNGSVVITVHADGDPVTGFVRGER